MAKRTVLEGRAPSVQERISIGKAARRSVPREIHRRWESASDRPDPLRILEAQATTRQQDLIPIRYGRMASSPFAFFRGAPAVMASDLSGSPNSGISVQLCGDAHLVNFGLFGSPEREIVFAINDFDETLPGPWEWDVQRLVASVAIAARQNGCTRQEQREAAETTARAYREAMRSFADMRTLDLWYLHMSSAHLMAAAAQFEREFGVKAPKMAPDRLARIIDKARAHDSLDALAKLSERSAQSDEAKRIASRPPLLVPIRELWAEVDAERIAEGLRAVLRSYRASLQEDRRRLLERFELVDVARKVVGVGSVGTRCFAALLQGKHADDVLFLQIKEAQPSALEPYLARSAYANHGHRVVAGQRLLQAVSDIFLGWAVGPEGGHFYVRQLRDMKGGIDPSKLTAGGLCVYGALCGWTLARAHARGGDEVAVAAYLGAGSAFDAAMGGFALAYADVNDRDHAALADAVASGRLPAITDV